MCDTLLLYYYAFVCLLSCIHLYLCDSAIYVIVIYDMCALYFEFFICHITLMLIWFASAFYSIANEPYDLYSCLFRIFWVHNDGLGHISLTNTFVLIDKSLYDPSMLKTSTLLHTRGGIVINHQKGGRLKASRPLVGFRWLMSIQDYYD